MKKIVLFATLLVCSVAALAQSTMLSPRAAMLLKQKNAEFGIQNPKWRVVSGGVTCVQAIVEFAEGVDAKAIDAYGMKIGTRIGNRATVLIPLERYAEVVASGVFSYIALAQEMRPLLDRARSDLGVDYIYQGLNMPQGYDGTGVVVGMIDIGFEYAHPAFRDITGETLRIKRVWQQNDITGTSPAGFTYGSEYATAEDILGAVTDDPDNGHGSHTSSIAAGCGGQSEHGGQYRGMAPGTEIVMVGCNLSDVGIVDGIRYIHEYARSVGKPCVINMSLGSPIGPHDGRDWCDLLTTDYVEGVDSLVLVVSASNSGSDQCHIYREFAGDTLRTFSIAVVSGDNYQNYLDFWGDAGDDFSLSIALNDYDRGSNVYSQVDVSPFMSTVVDSVYNYEMRSSRDSVYNVTVSVSHSNPGNGRPEILVMINKEGSGDQRDVFSVAVTSSEANVHMWNNEEDFTALNYPEYTEGNSEYTIGGFCANSDAVISVGSYSTRLVSMSNGRIRQYVMGEEGDLSYFSSHGPTVDGRVKPDICATGQLLVAAINTQYVPHYLSYIYDTVMSEGQTFYYALMQGTSMSSPAAAGIVALWLQQNPSLNVDSVRTLMHNSGRQDRFTGSIPVTGSNLWGWGKIDAFAGLPAPTVPMYYLDVAPSNWQHGIVSGKGRYPQGQYTIEAIAANGYIFVEWSDGNRDNPRVMNLNSDTTVFAQFEVLACDTISQFPWEAELSDEALVCWEKILVKGVSEWIPLMGSFSSVATSSEVDNWIITPHIIPASQLALTYSARSIAGENSLEVLIVTSADDTIHISDESLATNSSTERSIDLTPYAGQVMRVGFRHFGAGVSGGVLSLTSVRIEQLQGIGDVTDGSGVSIYTVDGRIQVNGADGMEVRVYDMMGRNVRNEVLPTGVYVVKVGEMLPRKVLVVR